MAIIETLNTVYNVKESRALRNAAFTAVLLTTGAAAFVIVSIHPDSHRGISEPMDRRDGGVQLAVYLLVDHSAMAYHLPLYDPRHQPHLLLGPKH